MFEGGGGGPNNVFLILGHRRISQRALRISPEKQLDARGRIAFRGVRTRISMIATCDFPGWGRGDGDKNSFPNPSGSAHVRRLVGAFVHE